MSAFSKYNSSATGLLDQAEVMDSLEGLGLQPKNDLEREEVPKTARKPSKSRLKRLVSTTFAETFRVLFLFLLIVYYCFFYL